MKIFHFSSTGPVLGLIALLIAGCGGGSDAPTPPPPAANQPPTANAGTDIDSYGKKTVSLDGSMSSDTDGSISSFAWSQDVADSVQVTLSDMGNGVSEFTIPDIFQSATLNFSLDVTDDDGAATSDAIIVNVLPAEHSLGLSIVGLGQSIQVTNSAAVTVSGFVSSDYELQSLNVNGVAAVASAVQQNLLGNVSTIDSQWSATLDLTEGDNDISVVAVSVDDTTVSIDSTLTYFPNLDFTTPLLLSENVIYVDDGPVAAIVTIGSTNVNVPVVVLVDTNDAIVANLKDDGVLPDEIQGDAIYSGAFDAASATEGDICYRVIVSDSINADYASESRCIWAATHYTPQQVTDAVETADAAKAIVDDALISGASVEEASIAALEALRTKPNVEVAGATGDGGVWWVDENGIPGVHHAVIDGQKSGSRPIARIAAPTPVKTADLAPQYYVANPHNRAAIQLDHFGSKPASSPLMSPVAETTAVGNRINSTRAAIFSPYIANPNSGSNFGITDDFFAVWQTIASAGSCQLSADSAFVNDGSIGISLDDFKNLSAFGYIHFSTHGDNYYRGLLSLWDPVWGPNNFLQGSLSVVALYTGVVLPIDPAGIIDITGYEDDLQAKRIVLGAGRTVVILPAFFKHYLTTLPNSLVSLSACRTMYNNSMANVFLQKGAGAVMGFDDYVLSTYAQNTTNTIMTDMLNNDSTFGDAVTLARNNHGVNDGQTTDPAALLMVGASDLQLSEGTFANLDFEMGALTPWVPDGDGRIIGQLGSTAPTGGSFMGVVSTGLGFTTSSGAISQSGCIAGDQTQLSFNWNFFSEEFLEYCASAYDDAFRVSVCDVAGTGCASFDTSVNLLCEVGAVTPSDVSFDQGGVYDTGWITETIDVSAMAGKKVDLTVYSTDVGDSIYDSAILVDDFHLQ
jgi:hypothetical protein